MNPSVVACACKNRRFSCSQGWRTTSTENRAQASASRRVVPLALFPWKVFRIWGCRCVCNSTACGLHLSLPQSLPSSPLPAPILPAHLPTLLPLSSRREPEEGDDPSQGRDVFNERPPAEELLALAEVAKQSTSALPENVVSRDSLLLGGTLAKWSPIRCEGMVHASASGNHLPRQAGRITLVSCPHARLP